MKEDDIRNHRERFVLDIRKNQREEKFKQSRKRLTDSSSTVSTAPSVKEGIIVDDRYKEAIKKYPSRHAGSRPPTIPPNTYLPISADSPAKMWPCDMRQRSQFVPSSQK
jgi:hypothetical protein